MKTGTGHSLGDFDAAILHELNEAGETHLVEPVVHSLTPNDLTSKDGEPVSDKATHQKMVEQACAQFIKTSLPQMFRLGIVEYRST